ncbi:MAG: CZB domain-containing protein, partial [Thermodesulfovibrionales bacterium]|nr:CZB domain-containing protein [Thermodesulfovibrionales bacterium]
INNILNSINHGTSETTLIMSEAVNKSEDVNQLVKTLNESFEEIFDGYQRVTEMVQQIVAGSEEQSATASEIAKNLGAIAEDARHSSKDVKEMASSFVNFTANAKAFLKTINSFKDKNIEIGVLKADYVLWLNRVIQVIDLKGEGLNREEIDPRNSRMGKWYYGAGKEKYSNLEVYRSLESRHVRFHEIGRQLVEAGKSGDREKARLFMNEISAVMKEIFESLDKLIK